MTAPRLDPTDYARLTAITTHTTLVKGIEEIYPDLSMEIQNAIVVDILDRVARMRGWELRFLCTASDEEEDGD
jgi:hypothetical protein